MISLTLYFLAIPVGAFILLWLFRIRSKKFLLGIPVLILLMPVIFGICFYALRTQIQQGKILPQLGPLAILLFSAEDMYVPLAEEAMSPDKRTYSFNLSHKYLGRHAVFIEVPSEFPEEARDEAKISIKIKIYEGEKAIYSSNEGVCSLYHRNKGNHDYYCVGYKVAKNIPVSKQLTMEVVFENDISKYLKSHENARVVVKKVGEQ